MGSSSRTRAYEAVPFPESLAKRSKKTRAAAAFRQSRWATVNLEKGSPTILGQVGARSWVLRQPPHEVLARCGVVGERVGKARLEFPLFDNGSLKPNLNFRGSTTADRDADRSGVIRTRGSQLDERRRPAAGLRDTLAPTERRRAMALQLPPAELIPPRPRRTGPTSARARSTPRVPPRRACPRRSAP